ncbi:MAG: extracellular solute-binding protein, partial [Candidatus Cloacimonetes bacterium]|nr:extracellular solute-binding protein [Candidatus Cloacimonadota bacterium]
MKQRHVTSEPFFFVVMLGFIVSLLAVVSGLLGSQPKQIVLDESEDNFLNRFVEHEKSLGRSIQIDNTDPIPGNLEVIVNKADEIEPRELTIWVTYNDEQFKVYQKLVQRFSQERGVQIKVSRIPFDGQAEKFQYACNSRTAPDIARMDIGNIPRFAVGKALLPMESFAGFANLKQNLSPAALSSALVRTQKGELLHFAIPDEYVNVALFYNKDLFIASGLEPKAPKTWAEFESVASRLSRDLDGDGLKDQYGFAMTNTLWWSLPFLYAFNGDIIDTKNLQCLLHNPEAVAGLEYQMHLSKSGLEAGAWRPGSIQPDTGFKNGRYAMILSGPWNLESFEQSGLNFGVDLIPGNPDLSVTSTTSIGGNSNVIFKSTKSPKLAFEFLSFMASAEVQIHLHETLGSFPINLPELEAMNYELKAKSIDVFIEQSRFARPRPAIPGYGRIESIVNNEVEAACSGSL